MIGSEKGVGFEVGSQQGDVEGKWKFEVGSRTWKQ